MFKSLFWAALLSVLAVGSTAVDSSLRGHELSSESDVRVLAPACIATRDLTSAEDFSSEVSTCLSRGDSCLPPLPCWDVSKVTDMSDAFLDKNLKNIDLSHWKTGNVDNMNRMFVSSTLTFSLANWDVSSVTNMASMFRESVVTDPNQDLGGWETGKVKDMNLMFYEASGFNPVVDAWDTSAVTNMFYMFKDSGFNQDIDSWDISQVKTMGSMFAGSPFDQCLSKWPGIKNENVITISMFDGTGCSQKEVADGQTTWCQGENCAVAPEPSDPEVIAQEPSDPEVIAQEPSDPEAIAQEPAACENAPGAFEDSNGVSETCDQRVARLNTPKQYHELCDDELVKKGCPGVCNWDRCSCTDYPTTFYPKGFEMTCTASGSARTIPDKQPGTSNHCRGLNRLLCRGTCLPMCNRDVGQSTR